MKKFFLHMLLVSVLGMLTVSCRDEYEEAMVPESSKAQVVFSVAMDTPVSRTRAAETWGNNDDPSAPGTPFDNRIDIDQLIVKIVDGDTEYEIVDIMKWKSGDNGYKFVGVVKDVTEAITLTDAKVYVYANMGTETPAETFEQDADYIPMWGVKKVSLSFAPGKRENAGEISLLRAMAKLEVKLANNEEMNEYELTSATLNKYNKKGNTHPTLTDGFNGNTESLGLEGVLNVKNIDEAEAGTDLALTRTEDGSSYVVYLPEVVNGTSETDWLKISVTLEEKEGDGTETGSFYIMNYPPQDQNQEPEAINIVRNHWYQYTINGFAASEIQVSYNAVPWTNVNIEIGGDGFLFLNKDLIEIYNGNISEGELKFSSSSPIKSIEKKDVYKHYRNGEIKETPVGEEADGVYAYYMDKFGVLTQLSNEEGSDEAVVLANISAEVKEENKKVLNGGITINSPFMPDNNATETALKSESHYNTVRYIEFLVTNEQNLTATFRVMQYPPVIVTNEEGFFSYRDDHVETDDAKPTHYQNFKGRDNLFLSGLMLYHEHDWTAEAQQSAEWHALPIAERNYSWLNACPAQGTGDKGWEELRYGYGRNTVSWGSTTATFSGAHRSTVAPTDLFLRDRYNGLPGATNMDTKGAAIGPYYERDGRIYRKHYVWNLQPVFYPKFVGKVYSEDGTVDIVNTKYQEKKTFTSNNKTSTQVYVQNRLETVEKQQGKADIFKLDASTNGWVKWQTYTLVYDWKYQSGRWRSTSTPTYYETPEVALVNHRMYNIKTSASNNEYNLGYVTLVDENGNPTKDSNIGVTEHTVSNASKVSPSFAVASQLGETAYAEVVKTAAYYNYILPSVKILFELAERHCKNYVETTYKDLNNNYKYDEGEPVTHYHDWRLPTKKEIEMIIDYQDKSRAMDRLLTCQYYFCVTGNENSEDLTNIQNWVSSEVPDFDTSSTGYYIRCVRDVKPEGQNGIVEKE